MKTSGLGMAFTWVLAMMVWMGCEGEIGAPVEVIDPHSAAMKEEATVKHLELDLAVDFEQEQLAGTAILELDRSEDATQLLLDSKGLEIESVMISPNGRTTSPTEFSLTDEDPILGSSLQVALESNTRFVHIQYKTTPGAKALQFIPGNLNPSGKPFLLTQSQAIHARTWVPIQDSPGIRFTYEAKITVPQGLMAIMSAENDTVLHEDGVYQFTMDQPIPAYLLALAVGELEFQALGNRTGVFADPSVIDDAAYEFAEVEQMMEIAEGLYGAYRWGRYDIVVLPPSFPFGGMENPRLTFATPTILAGDRSLVSLIAHELAHSWSGNLVTNATWNDFWLNEGFTVYFEYRIMEALKGRDYSEMLASISLSDLQKEVAELGVGSPDTRLAVDLTGRDPDDGMNAIAYEKGYYFLRLLEETVGRPAFDAFLNEYFSTFAFQTMNTEQFVAYLETHLLDPQDLDPEDIKLEEWVHGAGIPDNLPKAKSKRFDAIEEAISAWIAGQDLYQYPTAEWTSHEWLRFIYLLPDAAKPEQMAELDRIFGFSDRTNCEVLCKWFVKSVTTHYEGAYPAMERFLLSVGRRKFLTPIYTELMQTSEGKELAYQIYEKARPTYHPIAVETLDETLDWPSAVQLSEAN
ncbi:M1 family metallopeptidase [Pontibacter sp. G13]|uniref:M1 family metallopeptidase n=1 Tax=Pontibacter sp. G13 TaxID=3074898 RepID=UPI00288A2288|nr:M1 family metallopeptidase [Pontibacter sp. G13]WNJ20912.1 M1 family metallopeptidase [Pontibacter sp. G13]